MQLGALVIEKNDDEENVEEEKSDDDVVKGKGKLSKQDQPIIGQKTNSKGQVAWKFGGHIWYDLLNVISSKID
jgi:hypothetical protein